MVRKMTVIILAMWLTVSFAFAMGNPESEVAQAEKMTITWLGANQPGYITKAENVIELELEKIFDVELVTVQVDTKNDEQVNVLLAGGDVPDYIYVPQVGVVGKWADSKIIRPYTIDMMKENAPYLYETVEAADTANYAWKNLTHKGQLYGIPVVNNVIQAGHLMVTRKDWLDAVGADIDLEFMKEFGAFNVYKQATAQTLDEFGDMLEKFRTNDPDGNGKRDTYARSQSGADGLGWGAFPYVFGAYGFKADSWIKRDSKIVWSNVSDDFKNATKVLADWYKREIIDPEFIVDKTKPIRTKFVSGRLATHLGGSSEVGLRSDKVLGLLQANVPDLEPVYLTPPTGPMGTRGSAGRLPVRKDRNAFFGAGASDEKVAKILQMLNRIHSDLEIYTIAAIGLEGQHWDYDESGERISRDEWISPEGYADLGGQKFMLSNWIDNLNSVIRMPSWRLTGYNLGIEWPTWFEDFDASGVESFNANRAELEKIEDQFFYNAVTGKIDVDAAWADYLTAWKKAGGQEASDDVNKASMQ